MKEYESFARLGVMPHRSYYIPFAEGDQVQTKYKIVDRLSSSRFFSLDGVWQIKQHAHVEDFVLEEELSERIPVPACVQMHGYDQIQYLNSRYPFPVLLPHIPYENPCWHYRRSFSLQKEAGEGYYLNFEGVDSAFYLYINGKQVGYSQISHSTSEFDITDFLVSGENRIDVLVLKWSISTYLECQDKFRFSGIFRSVYILRRPQYHITDYKIETRLQGEDGILLFHNESPVAVHIVIDGQSAEVFPGETAKITVEKVKSWFAESPALYDLTLSACGEVIYEQVGFRQVQIDGKVFKINHQHIKLKGVNRHDFNCETAATVTLENMLEDLQLMKQLSVNAVRTSHYPNCPEFYQLCDVMGFYVMDEADVEMHGARNVSGVGDQSTWSAFAENELFAPGILDREQALVERDKNRTCVIIWSLGNESSFGKAFFPGAEYIRSRDSRPIHYESIVKADPAYYNTKYVDMLSAMYWSPERIRKDVLENEEENRPFILCEYSHAMGNSCGDMADYWKLIYSDEQMMGGFVWEWADHAVKTEKGFLYGGDFGEIEHDINFCVDGLVTPDRKIKSGALEMKAAHEGRLGSPVCEVALPEDTQPHAERILIEVDEHTGQITSLKADGQEVLRTPIHLNVLRYIDNDRKLIPRWTTRDRFADCKSYILSCEKTENGYAFEGALAVNCQLPVATYTASYRVEGNVLEIGLSYKLDARMEAFPRFGLEFGVDKAFGHFGYIGYGPTESYVDKIAACSYGYFESTAWENYDNRYIRPQESGSHYACQYLAVGELFTLTADAPFSCSVNPYTTKQIFEATHNFDLSENDFVNVCVDLAMRGIGSHSCGPALDARYEIPREGKATFRFVF